MLKNKLIAFELNDAKLAAIPNELALLERVRAGGGLTPLDLRLIGRPVAKNILEKIGREKKLETLIDEKYVKSLVKSKLVELMDDYLPEVRTAALEAFAALVDASDKRLIFSWLEGRETKYHKVALATLKKIISAEDIPELLEIFSREHWLGATPLDLLLEVAQNEHLLPILELIDKQAQALNEAEQGKEAKYYLLCQKNMFVCRLGGPEYREKIRQLLDGSTPSELKGYPPLLAEIEAVGALGRWGSYADLPLLMKCYEDLKYAEGQEKCLIAIASLFSRLSLPEIIASLDSDVQECQALAIKWLVIRGDKSYLPQIKQLLTGPLGKSRLSLSVQYEAIQAVAAWGNWGDVKEVAQDLDVLKESEKIVELRKTREQALPIEERIRTRLIARQLKDDQAQIASEIKALEEEYPDNYAAAVVSLNRKELAKYRASQNFTADELERINLMFLLKEGSAADLPRVRKIMAEPCHATIGLAAKFIGLHGGSEDLPLLETAYNWIAANWEVGYEFPHERNFLHAVKNDAWEALVNLAHKLSFAEIIRLYRAIEGDEQITLTADEREIIFNIAFNKATVNDLPVIEKLIERRPLHQYDYPAEAQWKLGLRLIGKLGLTETKPQIKASLQAVLNSEVGQTLEKIGDRLRNEANLALGAIGDKEELRYFKRQLFLRKDAASAGLAMVSLCVRNRWISELFNTIDEMPSPVLLSAIGEYFARDEKLKSSTKEVEKNEK